jgi:hypothetical protein
MDLDAYMAAVREAFEAYAETPSGSQESAEAFDALEDAITGA